MGARGSVPAARSESVRGDHQPGKDEVALLAGYFEVFRPEGSANSSGLVRFGADRIVDEVDAAVVPEMVVGVRSSHSDCEM